ncbi:MAG: hypothetical protein WDO12_09050 [Pseudomonadota bacterium]
MSTDTNAVGRQRLLAVTSALLEALYEPAAVPVLGKLKPADMRPGGARVPGTSYELEGPRAAQLMRELLVLRGAAADVLLARIAEADMAARYAVLSGKEPPRLASLYVYCTAGVAGLPDEAFELALKRLYVAAERIFTLTQMRRIDAQCFEWKEHPEILDAMPVQQFIARWVRNTL